MYWSRDSTFKTSLVWKVGSPNTLVGHRSRYLRVGYSLPDIPIVDYRPRHLHAGYSAPDIPLFTIDLSIFKLDTVHPDIPLCILTSPFLSWIQLTRHTLADYRPRHLHAGYSQPGYTFVYSDLSTFTLDTAHPMYPCWLSTLSSACAASICVTHEMFSFKQLKDNKTRFKLFIARVSDVF